MRAHAFVLASLVLCLGGAARAETRVVISPVTGFPDLLGLSVAVRSGPAEAELGIGAGPFVARAHADVGPTFSISDRRDADGRGWEITLPLRVGLALGGAGADDSFGYALCAEAVVGWNATYWSRRHVGLNLGLLVGGGYLVDGEQLGISAYPIITLNAGVAL